MVSGTVSIALHLDRVCFAVAARRVSVPSGICFRSGAICGGEPARAFIGQRHRAALLSSERRHRLGRFFSAIGYGFHRALEPARRIAMFFAVIGEEIKRKVLTNPHLRLLSWPIRMVYRLVAPLADFVIAWFWTRNYRSLLLGVPAFLLFLPLAICLIRIPLYGADAKARHYQRAAFEAIRNREHAKADLLFRKLTQLGVDRPAVIYSEASVMADEGDIEAAFEKMQSIAPLEEGGFAAAHFWIAQAIYSRIVTVPEHKRTALAEQHLEHVLSQFPNEPMATQLMADVLREAGTLRRRCRTHGRSDRSPLFAFTADTAGSQLLEMGSTRRRA